ncbi:hypothetical protein PHBOTO_002263 [Pseudozyma hubeiensis]|nr:hypothetical protein PHBOTO_002263 [Pseudozyma hubeiensis]
MKRRTTASVPPEALPHLRSPVPLQQNFVVPHTSAQTTDRTVDFPKTPNLLERIRRSQIRLDEEALSKAKNEGFRLSRMLPPDGPAEKNFGTSPAISEPHSAFEYAEYYDSYLPGAHLSVAPQGLSADDPALRWQDHSPSRSSALSPRRSTTVSMRQRSATLSQASPAAWPSSLYVDDGSKVASRHPSKRRLDLRNSHRDSAQVDEVIRF